MGSVEKKKSYGSEKCAYFILDMLKNVAIKNAHKACRGFIYEPEVPSKLKTK